MAFCGRVYSHTIKKKKTYGFHEGKCREKAKTNAQIYIVIRICPVILSFVCVKSLEMCVLDENIMRRRRKLIFGAFYFCSDENIFYHTACVHTGKIPGTTEKKEKTWNPLTFSISTWNVRNSTKKHSLIWISFGFSCHATECSGKFGDPLPLAAFTFIYDKTRNCTSMLFQLTHEKMFPKKSNAIFKSERVYKQLDTWDVFWM